MSGPALDGLDPRWSRFVTVRTEDDVPRTWHLLDNRSVLADRPTGRDPAGTLLCVHGNPTWSYLWRHLVAAATAADPPWRVVAVDQLGMGFSERTGMRRLGRRIDDLGRLTDTLELSGPVVTVGHDWGGAVSLGWALAHRDQLAGMVLLNTAVHQPAGSSLPALIALARLPGLRPAVTSSTATFVSATLALAHPRLPARVRSGYLAPYRSAARRTAIDDFVADIPVSPRHPSWPALQAVADGLAGLAGVPALLLWGPRDPVFTDLYLRDLRSRLPQAAVHRFEGAGHLLAEDVDVAGTVLRWLAEAGSPTEPGTPTHQPEQPEQPDKPRPAEPAGGRRPLWAALGERAGDATPAAVAPAGRTGTVVVSWAELAGRVEAVAAGLAVWGVRAGDRVALLVPAGTALLVGYYACLRIGAVAVLADPGLGLAGLHRAVRGAGVRHVIAIDRGLLLARVLRWPGSRVAAAPPGPVRGRLLGAPTDLDTLERLGAGRPLPPPPGPDAEAMVAFTSGATGPAKGVVYTHRRLEAARDLLARAYGLTADDRFVAAFAPFALLGPALGMATAVPAMDVTAPGTLTASALATAVDALAASVVFASPAALANVLATAPSLSATERSALARVRLLLSAGAPVSARLLRAISATMPAAALHTPYGMTEALLVSDVSLTEIISAGDGDGILVGRPLPGVDVALAPLDHAGGQPGDDDEITVKPDVTGEVVVRGAHVKERYDQLWATDRAAARPAGWHRTGDVGHLDADGRLWIEGRTVHVLSPASGLVTPVGVEQRMETLPEVARAALTGVGPQGGQQLVAVLETTPPPARTRLRRTRDLLRVAARADRPAIAIAEPQLAARVRAVAGVELAAVLVTTALPTDIRHNSKIDRLAVGRSASRLLAGSRRR